MTALITELERGSSVDGPGIRTVVFLKGCPLHCLWCHNPETVRREPEIIRDLKRCVKCGLCQTLPPNEAEKRCPVHAAEITGHLLSIEDFQHIVLRDAKFISNGGGVTFSGGEPLMQAEELLRHGDLKLSDVAGESGFATQKSFYDFFREYHNTTPKEWMFRNR